MDTIRIKKEFAELIPQLSPEEYVLLEESIILEGLRDPIITWNGFIVDGHNRYQICTKNKLEIKSIEKEFENETEAILWIINNQLARRNLSIYQRGVLVLKLEKLFEGRHGGDRTQGGNISTLKGKSRDLIGKQAKVSGKTIDKIRLIEEKAPDKIKEQIREGKISINKAYKDIRIKERRKEIKINPQKIPEGKFNVILADPPWQYEFSETESRAIENQYPTMTLEDIKKLKVPSAEDSILFLWATAPKLLEAIEVMKSWGFEYRSQAIWDKEIIGMGYYFRIQHEILLVGIKGKINTPSPEDRISSVIKEKRGKHSAKPEKVYEIIERMYPNRKYLELFSRNKRDKWTSWGNGN